MTGKAGRSVPTRQANRYDRQSRKFLSRNFRLALLFPYRRERPAAGGPDDADGSVGDAPGKPPPGMQSSDYCTATCCRTGKFSYLCPVKGRNPEAHEDPDARCNPGQPTLRKRFATARGICAKLRHFIILNSSAYGSSQSLFAPAKSVPQRSVRPDARRSSAVRVAARPASINSSAR